MLPICKIVTIASPIWLAFCVPAGTQYTPDTKILLEMTKKDVQFSVLGFVINHKSLVLRIFVNIMIARRLGLVVVLAILITA